MLPFTKEQVIDAYKRHPEVKPATGNYISDMGDGQAEACGIGCLLLDAGKGPEFLAGDGDAGTERYVPAERRAIALMGWPEDSFGDINAFISGFDSQDTYSGDSEARRIGAEVSRELGIEIDKEDEEDEEWDEDEDEDLEDDYDDDDESLDDQVMLPL